MPGAEQPRPQHTIQPGLNDRDATRREVVAIALRDTLRRQGIPSTWITADLAPALTARKERGMHLRLILREWQPELLAYTVALQRLLRTRIARLDPMSLEWLTGVSWKFELVDETLCPSLPDASYWPKLVAARARTELENAPTQPATLAMSS